MSWWHCVCAALHGVGLEIQFGMCMAVPVLVRKARERMSNFGVGEYFCATPLTLSLSYPLYLSLWACEWFEWLSKGISALCPTFFRLIFAFVVVDVFVAVAVVVVVRCWTISAVVYLLPACVFLNYVYLFQRETCAHTHISHVWRTLPEILSSLLTARVCAFRWCMLMFIFSEASLFSSSVLELDCSVYCYTDAEQNAVNPMTMASCRVKICGLSMASQQRQQHRQHHLKAKSSSSTNNNIR